MTAPDATPNSTPNTAPEPAPDPARRPRLVITLIAWIPAVPALVWAIAAWFPRSFITDHLAGLAAQALMLALPAAAFAAILRRPRAATAAALAAALLIALLLWAHRTPAPANDNTIQRFPLTTLITNFYAYNTSPQAAFAQAAGADADLLAWVETPSEIIDRLRWDTEFRAKYPHAWIPDRAGTGFPILLSRWPLLARRSGWKPTPHLISESGYLLAIVDHPEGAFIAVWMSPRSPRHPERWNEGNDTVRKLARDLAQHFGTTDQRALPIVVLGDQNATPTNWRSRHLRAEARLRRAKPLTIPAGTFPASLPWPLTVAIDDALVSDQVRITAWQTLQPEGSDHRPVLIEMQIPAGHTVPSPATTAPPPNTNP
ncbi:MAG: endonuclease/exonuclease/phosphatase family protein [Phycisphaerales bacterium]